MRGKSISKRTFVAIGGLAVLISALAYPAAATHGGGLVQSVSATLNLPAVPNPGAEVCTGADSQGNPTNCRPISIPSEAKTLSLAMSYTLVNASHLPSVDAIAGSAAVPCPDPIDPTKTTKKPGIALIAAGATFKSGSSGSLSVNGEKVQDVQPSDNATEFYQSQALFLRFCNL